MSETGRQSFEPAKESTWAPLRLKVFRALWLAQLGSLIGTWMQTVGAQWLLVDEPGAETLVAMVQVAALLPALVLALPAGALADILDRRRMLIGVQLFLASVGAALAALALVVVLLRLRRPRPAEGEAPEHFASAIRAGQRYVRHSLVVRRMLLRVALLTASARSFPCFT